MRGAIAALILIFVLSACNLSADSVTPTAESVPSLQPPPFTLEATVDLNAPTALPGIVPQPTNGNGLLPTRTPFGNLLPLNPNATPLAIPTSSTGETATVSLPIAGSQVMAGNLQINGVVSGLARDEFTLLLLDSDGRVLNQQLITVQNPNQIRDVPWSASMTTSNYLGAAEVRLVARNPLDQEIVLARVPITLVQNTGAVSAPAVPQAVSGATASIDSPPDNGTFSGSVLQVSGMAGGFADNQFVVALVAPDGVVINSQIINLTGAGTNTVPWSAALDTNGYRGRAEIRAFPSSGSSTTLDSVQITIQ